MILDTAGQKGTGKWTSQAAMDLGVPIPTIDSAVSMRQISSQKTVRTDRRRQIFGHEHIRRPKPFENLGRRARRCPFCAFILTYAQGMSLLQTASIEKKYGLDLAEIARIWRGGCIIRSKFLEAIRKAYANDTNLESLLLDKSIADMLNSRVGSLRKTVVAFNENGIPAMCFSSALAYFDAFRNERLPANLIQAQRDFSLYGSMIHFIRRIGGNVIIGV